MIHALPHQEPREVNSDEAEERIRIEINEISNNSYREN